MAEKLKKIIFLTLAAVCINLSLYAQFQNQLSEILANEVKLLQEQATKFEESKQFNEAALQVNRIATIYSMNGFPFKAITNYEKAIDLYKNIGNLNAQYSLYTNIGIIYIDEEDYTQSIESFDKALEAAKKMKRKPDIAAALINIANAQGQSQQYSKAAKNLEEALILARESNDQRMLRNCYFSLADIYEKLGNKEKSTEAFTFFTAISQKMQGEEIRQSDAQARKIVDKAKEKVVEIEQIKKATELELKSKQQALKETEENLESIEQISIERQMQIELLSKEKELKDITIENQRLVRNIFVLIIIIVIAIALLSLYNLNIKKKANQKLKQQNIEIAKQKDLIEMVNQDLESAFNKIEKQNRNITSSINYAQRIQEALLPKTENLSNLVPDSFLYFKPRDIVSGDFYWYTGYGHPQTISKQDEQDYIKLHGLKSNEKGFLISAVDCTGHGVPGAFMSMIGYNILETIVRNGTTLPNEILNQLHHYIRYLLKQDTTDNRDGMDIAICAVVDNGSKILFSGAKNPLLYICNGELNYIKGDVYPIGGLQKEVQREFTLHTIEVNEPTSFYLFSDGYTDQFGGRLGKKFGTKSFKQLLLEISHLPMAEQQPILEAKMKEWVGNNYKQIDDNLIIGFKITPEKTTV
ncbi:MAG: tetratricopeptide repeat protein [Bacteroidales bacterium]